MQSEKQVGEIQMDKLKELLGELYDQVVAKIGDKKLLVDDGSFIPEYRFKEKVEEVKSLKERSKKYEEDIEKLKPFIAGNEALTKKLEEAQVAQKKADDAAIARQLRTQKEFAVKESLLDAQVLDPEARDLLSRKFDIDKMELDEKGKLKGFDEILKPIKDNPSLKGLFGTRKFVGQEHKEGEVDLSTSEYAKSNPFSKATRNILKQIELKRQNPALASKLEAEAN